MPGVQPHVASKRLASIYQNPLLNPANGIKSVGPSPVLSTEQVWQNLERSVGQTKKTSASITQTSKKPEGWNNYVDHTNFIESMFNKIHEDIKDLSTNKSTGEQSTKKGSKSKTQGTPEIQKTAVNEKMKTASSRKLVAPWKIKGSFASPSALEKKTFENFYKMAPDPPKTLNRKPSGAGAAQNSSQAQRSQKPRESKVLARAGAGAQAHAHFVVDSTRLQLIPSSAQTHLQPKSLPLPVAKSKSRLTSQVGRSFFDEKRTLGFRRDSPLRAQSILAPNNKPRSRATRADLSRILYGARGQLSPPVPLSKRRDFFPQNQSPLYHNLSYTSGRRSAAHPIVNEREKSVRTVRGAGRTQVNSANNKPTTKPQSQPTPPEVVEKPKSKQVAQERPSASGRRLRPAMLFPFHVPGPEHDNIYIGAYHSDTEIVKKGEESLESGTDIAKKAAEKKN